MQSIISLSQAHIQNCYLCKQHSPAIVCCTCEQAFTKIHAQGKHEVYNLLARSAVQKSLGKTTFDSLICAMEYRWPFDYLIKQFKFKRKDYLAKAVCKHLLTLLNLHLQTAQKPDAIVPVPIHIKRYSTRRFNQASIIAQVLSTQLDIPVNYELCVRKQFTLAQTQLSGRKRKQNLGAAFHAVCIDSLQHIAIVDDVMTTGATVEALAKVIKKHNPHLKIEVWALAISSKTLGVD